MHAMNGEQGQHVAAKESQSVAGDNSSSSAGVSVSTSSGTAGSSSGSFSAGWGSGTSGDPDVCPSCGQPLSEGGLEKFLGRLGITTEMIDSLKGQFENVNVDEYLNTAREYLNDGSGQAQTYAKENPGKIVAGVAAFALGAGLLWSKCASTQEREDRSRQLEMKNALRGRKYRLDEVLRELDVTL
jgi:hypothetical protein